MIFLVIFLWAHFQLLMVLASDNLPYPSFQPCWILFSLYKTGCSWSEFPYGILEEPPLLARALPFDYAFN